MQRFKEMKEMHGSSSRDDRQKREQQRQEKEMAKFVQMYTIIFPSLVYIRDLFLYLLLYNLMFITFSFFVFFNSV